MLAAAMVVVFPAPLPGLRARVEREISRALGVPVTVRSARLYLADRQLLVRGVRLPGESQDLEIDHVAVNLRFGDWRLWRAAPRLARVEARGVRGAELLLDGEGVHLQRVGTLLARWPSGEREARTPLDLSRLRIPALSITETALTVIEVRPDRRVALFQGEGLAVDLTTRRGEPTGLRWQGRWLPEGRPPQTFRGHIERGEREADWVLSAEFDEPDTATLFRLPGDLHLTGRRLTLTADVDLTPRATAVRADLAAEGMHWAQRGLPLEGPGSSLGQEPAAHVELRLDEGGQRWVLENSVVELSGSRLAAEGTLRRGPGLPLEVRLAASHAPMTVDLLNVFLSHFGVEIDRGNLALEVTIRGLANEPRELRLAGRLAVTDGVVRVGRGEFSDQCEDLRAEITFSRSGASEEFRVADLHGTLGELGVSIPEGRAIRREIDSAARYEMEARFLASGEISDTADRLPIALPSLLAGTPRGRVAIEGSLRHAVTPSRSATVAERWIPEVEGSVRLEDGEFLLAPDGTRLRVPEVTASFDNRTLHWENAQAEYEGTEVMSSGRVTGEPLFWQGGQIDAGAEVEIDVASFGPQIAAAADQLPLEGSPTGTARVDIRAEGPLQDPLRWRTRAVVSPRDLRVTLRLPAHALTLELSGGELEVSPQQLAMRDLLVSANGLGLALTGSLAAGQISLEADGTFDLGQIADVYPRIGESQILSGPAALRAAVRIDLPEAASAERDMTRPAALARLGRESSRLLAEHLSREAAGAVSIDAALTLEGCTVTPKVFPADVTDVRGTVLWDGRQLVTTDAMATFHEDENVVLSASLDPGFPERVSFDLYAPHADLTPWVRAWRRRGWEGLTREEVRARVYDPSRPARWQIVEGTIHADAVTWRTLQGGASELTLRNEFHRHDRRSSLRIDFHPLSGYGGTARGHHTLVSTDEGTRQDTVLEVRDVSANEFLTDLRGENVAQLQGRVTGRAEIHREPNTEFLDMTADGVVTLRESTLMRNTLFAELASLTGLRQFRDISFTTVTAAFHIEDRVAHVSDLLMDTSFTDIRGQGTLGFDGTLDFEAQLEILSNLFSGIPVVGWISSLIDTAFDTVLLTIRVDGTIRRPRVHPEVPIVSQTEGAIRGIGERLDRTLGRFSDILLGTADENHGEPAREH